MPARADASPFDRSIVRQMARDAAGKPYKAPDTKLPDNLKDLDYDHYRAIRFLPERALWRGEKLPFEVQFFHRGFFYANRVDIYEVANGQATKIAYQPEDFSFGDNTPPPAPTAISALPASGFTRRSTGPTITTRSASFSAPAISAPSPRARSTGCRRAAWRSIPARPRARNFPLFKTFWIEKPAPNANSIVVHALLDSESAAAAYRFTIRPGETTVFDVEMAIYPRVDLDHAGLAPMTSMFFFGPNDRKDVDDFRPAVHDSDGLAIYQRPRRGAVASAQQSAAICRSARFADLNPRGFGLMQRQKNFAAYQDLESSFERRPSLWAEPIGDWGEGAVQLLEIPTKEEIHDNIAGFWHPKDAAAGQGRAHLHLSAALGTRHAQADVAGAVLADRRRRQRRRRQDIRARPDRRQAEVGRSRQTSAASSRADKAEIQNIVTQPNPATGGWRLSFELAVKERPRSRCAHR